MMQNFEEHLLGRSQGEDDLTSEMSSTLQSLRFRLGLENSSGLGNRLESQEDALQNLSHRDWTIRVEAIRILGASGKHEFVKPLTVLLQDRDMAVREAVAKALGELGGEASVTPLVSCLKDEAWSVRATALQSLGKLGEFAPIEPLVAGLEDEDVSVRLAAVRALEKQAKRVPLEVFVTVLGDKVDLVRSAAIRVIERLLEHPEQCVFTNTFVNVLIEKAKSKEEDVRLAAVDFLRILLTHLLSKAAYTVQGNQAKIVYAKLPWVSKEQGDQSLVESSLFLPQNKIMHSGTPEYYIPLVLHACLHSNSWNSSFRKGFFTRKSSAVVPWQIRCLAGLPRTPGSFYELDCKVISKIAEREIFPEWNVWKDCLRQSEFRKQVAIGQRPRSSSDFLILLYSVEYSLEELRRSAWPIFGASDFEKGDFLTRFLPSLLQVHWSELCQFMEPSVPQQKEQSASIELFLGVTRELLGVTSLLSLGNAIGSNLTVITKDLNEDVKVKESPIQLIQSEKVGNRTSLYTPVNLCR